jgi:integral membrane sensor domain MASE1
MRKRTPNAWTTALSILSLATVYFIASKFVLSFPVLPPKASAISPATGIALASLLLWGNRLWPGVFLGAFLVSITTQGAIAVALAIAFGNTLQAVLGAWLIDHFANGPKVFERAKNTLKLALLAAFISTTVSAIFGVSSLILAAYAQPDPYTTIWLNV